jgi:Asp/Glu/hydantoin racemase
MQMQKNKKIYLIHATQVSIEPVNNAFRKLWPEAILANLLEDSLSKDLVTLGGQTHELMERFLKLCQYSIYSGAEAILFNCSSFSSSIDYCKTNISIPVFKPNEAMIEDALELTPNIGLIASFEPAIASIQAEFTEYANKSGKKLALQSILCPRALEELQRGNISVHNQLIAENASKLNRAEVLCFAQFSMSSAAQLTKELSGKPVLTTPESAVLKMRHQLLSNA